MNCSAFKASWVAPLATYTQVVFIKVDTDSRSDLDRVDVIVPEGIVEFCFPPTIKASRVQAVFFRSA